jgi:hypothetical protein
MQDLNAYGNFHLRANQRVLRCHSPGFSASKMMHRSDCHPGWEVRPFPGLEGAEVSALRKTCFLMVSGVCLFVCLQVVVMQGE